MAKELGIDIGTSNTTIFVRGKGIVLREPSAVAVEISTGKPIAVGEAAERMVGRTPKGIEVIKPVRNGAIADFEIAEYMLKEFVEKALGPGSKVGATRMIIAVPTDITEVEQLAVLEAAKRACSRAKKVKPRLIQAPLAAAIGADLTVGAENVEGSMLIDIGGGTTECAVFSLGGILKYDSLKIGGEKFDQQIINYLKTEKNLVIGEKTAERIKIEYATLFSETTPTTFDVLGRDIITGLPNSVQIDSTELIETLREPVIKIIECAKLVLDGLQAEISADIAAKGLILTGGSANMRGLCEFMRTELNIPVRVADNAEECVAYGAGRCLTNSVLRALINSNLR